MYISIQYMYILIYVHVYIWYIIIHIYVYIVCLLQKAYNQWKILLLLIAIGVSSRGSRELK